MKKLFTILLVLTMLLALCACGNADQPETTAGTTAAATDTAATGDQTESNLKSFTVVVVHKDGTSKEFTYETDEEFVGKVLQDAGLIEGTMGQYGLEIHTVDGEKAVYAEDKAYWAIYEGEEYAMQGIDATPVVDGRTYKLVYTGA